MGDLTIQKGDNGFYLYFYVQSSSNAPYDLTDYTIKFKVWKPNFPSILLLNGTCAIVNATAGICRYLVTSADFTTIGNYLFELELTKTDVVESTAAKSLSVMESG